MKQTLWRRVAIALGVFNVAGAGFAIASGLQERVDFAERMLAQTRERLKLG